ncbi:aldehyde dehydrogenase family protein [Aedoeadaptatus acetigenes]|uniref:aldehyde dehydrogenase family protein n=1 Tax=Aedoeadaptatus acetigenes TaxID=2981723 RepID=UPI002265CAA7|nr:aldehyde dehydrogenase family protein [Aedoeadaptatus acetigenes]MCU6787140.1 aldehyde dehydrogenase family protein [Aedoeadaptatus acetigenes]
MNSHDAYITARDFYCSGKTRPVLYRKKQLYALLKGIDAFRGAIDAALKADLNKSSREAFLTEIYLVKAEIRHMIRHLNRYGRTLRPLPGAVQLPGRLSIRREPYGAVLVISPWNYPFQLSLLPVVGAIAAGNAVVVKPSEFAPETGKVLEALSGSVLDEGLVSFVFGEEEAAKALLSEPFDKVFFTGNSDVGRSVMKQAAAHPSPVVLELGGKSPVIVDETADIPMAAKRIAFGKTMNAGQTCVAPDTVYVHASQKEALIDGLLDAFEEAFPTEDYFINETVRMNHRGRYARMKELAEEGDIRTKHARIFYDESLHVFPCVVENPQGRLLEEEIFGPLLPVIAYESEEALFRELSEKDKPLALYLFSKDEGFIRRAIRAVDSGGVCINDNLMHLASNKAPFGGIGPSGMGAYHGKWSYEAFSRPRTVLKKSTRFDISLRYHPF